MSETQFWQKPTESGNSFGHLVLHLAGNLNHFAGTRLGQTGYVRDREREFTDASPRPRPRRWLASTMPWRFTLASSTPCPRNSSPPPTPTP